MNMMLSLVMFASPDTSTRLAAITACKARKARTHAIEAREAFTKRLKVCNSTHLCRKFYSVSSAASQMRP